MKAFLLTHNIETKNRPRPNFLLIKNNAASREYKHCEQTLDLFKIMMHTTKS